MIYIAWDRYGYGAIRSVRRYLAQHAMEFEDRGSSSADEDMRLEIMIPRVVEGVLEHEGNLGILACGTGIGVEIGANKFARIRACLAANPKLAEWAVTYDRCNVVCLPGWGVSEEEIFAILDAWFSANYDGDEERLKMFEAFDNWH